MNETRIPLRRSVERLYKLVVPILIFGLIGEVFFDIFVYSIAVPHFHWDFSAYPPIAAYSRVIGSCLCLTLLAWQEKGNFSDFNLDNLTILLFSILGLLRSDLRVPGYFFYKVVIAALSIILLTIAYRYGEKQIKVKGRWVAAGILISLLAIVPLSYIESFSPARYSGISFAPDMFFIDIGARVVQNLSFVSPYEELLYRSLIWGYLRRWGWAEMKIFWFQAFLFWLLHIRTITTPVTFFISIPIITLIFSFLALRSRQLFPSILAHTVINSIVPLLALYFLQ